MVEKFGKKLEFDSEWRGPLGKRSCTDIFCLLIFIVYLFCWGGIDYYAYTYGDVQKLMVPTDSEGRKCGIDSAVKDKPYLLFFDLTKCISASTTCSTPQVCQPKCPTNNFIYTSKNPQSSVEETKLKLICEIGINLTLVSTWEDLDILISNEKCARWYLNSTPITRRCVPLKPLEGFVDITINEDKLNLAKKAIKVLTRIERVLTEILEDLQQIKYQIPIFIIGSGTVTITYILFLRWFTTPFVCLSIFGICVLLGAGTYICYDLYSSATGNVSKFWLALTIICGIVLGIIILINFFLRKRIYLACQLIQESSKAVSAILFSLLFPIFPWVLKILVLLFSLIVGFNLVSLREPIFKLKIRNETCNSRCDPEIFSSECRKNNQSCVFSVCQFVENEIPTYLKCLLAYNIIGFIWVTFFVSDLGRMILAATFATWYWTFRKEDVPFFTVTVSVWRTFRYHLGTVAFGSLLITTCQIIRKILEAINKKLKQYNNAVGSAAIRCCKLNFWLLDNVFKYIDYNAYIMCAVHGKNFFLSAKESFSLLMRNIIRVILLTKITDWILGVGKIFITGLSVFSTWWWYHQEENVLHYWIIPVFLVGIGSWVLTSVFFQVQAAAIDTLFLCFLEDSERNDGSYEKPYFMNRKLKKVLHR